MSSVEGRTARAILTVTVNPALDVSTAVAAVTPEHKLRCEPARQEPGGGGVNVARVASRLGANVRAVVVVGGPTGSTVVALMEAEGLDVVPVVVDAETRQCLAVTERSTDRQFRFVLPGPAIDEVAIGRLGDELDGLSGGARPVVVISGSFPEGTEAGALSELIERLRLTDVVVDTSGAALAEAVRSGVFMIKPSARELAAVVDRPLVTEADVIAAAKEVVADSSVGAVLASIGAGGAVLVQRDGRSVRLRAPAVRVRSAVGAGDSLVGALATGLARGEELVAAAALGVAAGTAATLSEGSGLCASADVQRLQPLVAVEDV